MTVEGKHIAIVGAGLVGSGWAVVFARAGHDVRVYDPSEAVRRGVLSWAKSTLSSLHSAGLLDDPTGVLERIDIVDSMAGAVRGAAYIQESVFETVEAKSSVSLEIDRYLSAHAVVGSSSSGIPASRFTESCENRTRFLVAHPVNPPHLVPVVELVPAPWTDPLAIDRARQLMGEVGQVPVTLQREVDGFILNRLQGALLNEAFALYSEGYSSISDIDATVRAGLGLRWLFMGPFETIDLNAPSGIADYAARLGPMYHQMALSRRDPQPWSPETIKAAEAERRTLLPFDQLAQRREWRDHVLARLSAFKLTEGIP
ncbi:3-hydroxyacyl-CoA dehydrogenase [Rhizobium leguminosarum]|uniref:3-hydroxyacyl-CoA dehydrogenase n=1 Tax=Rhizobium leguminosarum TaxID=384 RepID=UPI001C91941F|nr:3-hydroxyacyl-CoA dehydrogenase [Rhizobium leguminosarum]MBY2973075.1 3-hydroxyacyl-CoA dehydrogenase [Rhizobium leguminosarum]MBY2980475.1 3-hydroxyacyl-CoA dehydrogenase [Rhizobium leguminosarum]MBY3009026.1 3-hydroxyacyl-CoA dehydrogenase [Rhizobium leguminosarum]